MKPMIAASMLLALNSAHAATQTVDCGRLLDVQKGAWRERVSIVIENGSIVSVGPMTGAAGNIDLSRHACLPGLIDMHVHLTSETQPVVDSYRDRLTADPADMAYRSVKYAERTLMAGFTTVRDLGAADNLNIALKRAIAAGEVPGPRMFTAGKSLATTGGHADPTNNLSHFLSEKIGTPGPVEGVLNSPEEARQAVRTRYKDGADLIKVTATGGVLSQAASGQNSQYTEDELRAGVDSIEHGTLIDDEVIALFKKSGGWYVPTISAGRYVADKAKDPNYYSALVRPKAAAIGPQLQATFGRAHKAGVKIAFGTDAGVFPHGENAKEFGYMVEAGMSPADAIRSATVNAALLLDQPTRLGAIAPGFAADIIAVEGDPLQDVKVLEQVKFVMKDGVVYKKP